MPGRKAKAVDATGAGDAFWGAFLAKLRLLGVEKASDLTEERIRRAMDYGNVSGWISLCSIIRQPCPWQYPFLQPKPQSEAPAEHPLNPEPEAKLSTHAQSTLLGFT